MATRTPPVKVEITRSSIAIDGVDISRSVTAFTLEFDANDSRIPTLTVTLRPGATYDGPANVTIVEEPAVVFDVSSLGDVGPVLHVNRPG